MKENFVFAFIVACFALNGVNADFISATDYWPDIAGDLTVVSWSHATNNISLLEDALADDEIDFIEADVNLGWLVGHESDPQIPIMAHPPTDVSDLSLEDFMNRVIAATTTGGKKKGIKLDFKLTGILLESYEIIKKVESDMTME